MTAAILFVLMAQAAAPGPVSSSLHLAAASEPGQRLEIAGLLLDDAGKPIAGAQIHIYQTDATGYYTPERAMDEPHARLSGWLRTDNGGRFRLVTIRPGGYPQPVHLGDRDRKIPAHIHMDIKADGYAPRNLQAVFIDDPRLADSYWQEWVRRLGQPVITVRQNGSLQSADLVLHLQGVKQKP